MKRVKGQGSRVKGVKFAAFIFLLMIHCLLFTVVTGCGKKAPPKPPQEAAWQR